MPDLDWTFQLERASGPLTLLLLHSAGGDEGQLLELGRVAAPGAHLLGVRGRSLEEGHARYFRRFGATDYDQAQVVSEADALASFVQHVTRSEALDPARVVLLGYGNGAGLGLATLLRWPGLFAGAALLRPVLPLDEPPAPALAGLPALLLHGAYDPYAPHAQDTGPLLRSLGAEVEDRRVNAEHEITDQDIVILTRWLGAFAL